MNPRWKNLLLVAAIFAVGVVTGSVQSLGLGQRRTEHRLHVDNLRSALMQILTQELDLTPDQVQRIEPLVTRACEDYRNLTLDSVRRVSELVAAANERIARELTPAQAAKLRQLEEERQTLVRKRLDPNFLKRDFLPE
jgi:Spy/CpxP family protein refolding chaperone